MELVKYGDYTILYQRQGNDKNGNPLYIVNIFHNGENVNYKAGCELDKYGNIKTQSYNIKLDAKFFAAEIEEVTELEKIRIFCKQFPAATPYCGEK